MSIAMTPASLHVFISSTWLDLQPERKVALTMRAASLTEWHEQRIGREVPK